MIVNQSQVKRDLDEVMAGRHRALHCQNDMIMSFVQAG